MTSTSLWRGPPLLLASTSPTRLGLLRAAGLPVETEAPGVDERAVENAAAPLGPEALARRLAAEKALAVSRRHPERLVLGADQVLDLAGERLHKPDSRDDAARQIAALAGREHRLHAAAVLALGGEIVGEVADAATLRMRPLSQEAIERYLDLAGPAAQASVGAYQLEGLGVHLFERVEGDHTTILGLPMLPLLQALRGLGSLAL